MSYPTNPASGGLTFRSRVHAAEHTPTVEADDVVLKQLIDEASSTVTYVCEAAIGASTTASSWRIRRITVTGTVTMVEWAGGGGFDQVAANRAALAYS